MRLCYVEVVGTAVSVSKSKFFLSVWEHHTLLGCGVYSAFIHSERRLVLERREFRAK